VEAALSPIIEYPESRGSAGETLLESVERVKAATGVFRRLAVEGLGQQLDEMAPLVRPAMKRTKARIRRNARSESRLLGLFEPPTDVIRKGQAGKPNEFGKMVKLQERRSGLSFEYGVRAAAEWCPPATSRYRVASSIAQTRAAFRRRAKLQVEINDKNSIKAGDDWRCGIIGDLKDSDWVFSCLSGHSIRDPGVCLDELGLALHGKGGAIATVLIEGATGRPCGHAYVLCDSLAIVVRGARHSGVTAGKRRSVTRMAVPRTETAHARPQAPLAVSGVPDTDQPSSAFSLGQSPEALSRDG
jgi:hypothetical protein